MIRRKTQQNDKQSSNHDILPVSMPARSGTSNNEHRLHTIQFAVSVAMHLQGLWSLLIFDGTPYTMMCAIAGAGLEGIFFTSLVAVLLSKQNLLRRVLASLIGISAVSILLSDFFFRERTGGENPDMWVLASGFKEGTSLLKAELINDTSHILWSIFGALVMAGPAVCFVVCRGKELAHLDRDSDHKQNRKQLIFFYLIIFAGMVILYTAGAWMPIFHAYSSYCGIFIFSSPDGIASRVSTLKESAKNHDPAANNVLVIIHESLSGEIMMTDDSVVSSEKKLMPFFQQMLQSDGEYFVFENARSVSGDTTDAVTSIQSGCLPLNHEDGRDFALNTTLATEFKKSGFETISFSSRDLVSDSMHANLLVDSVTQLSLPLTCSTSISCTFLVDVERDEMVHDSGSTNLQF